MSLGLQSAVGFINMDAIWYIKGNPDPYLGALIKATENKKVSTFWLHCS